MSQFKGLEAALKFPGAEHIRTWYTPFTRIDTFRSPAVRYAPGLSLRYLEPLPEQIGVSIDGGEVHAVTAAADPEKLTFLEHLPAALPYALGPRPLISRDTIVRRCSWNISEAVRSGESAAISSNAIINIRIGMVFPPLPGCFHAVRNSSGSRLVASMIC